MITITLDSGAGVSAWPHAVPTSGRMQPKQLGLAMALASGTNIANYGQKVVKLKGVMPSEKSPVQSVTEEKPELFIRQA